MEKRSAVYRRNNYNILWPIREKLAGDGGWFFFFDCSRQFLFSIDFHCNFSMFYKIRPCRFFTIVFSFVHALLLSTLTPLFSPSLSLSFLSYFILHIPIYARVFGKTLAHVFPIFYCHTEWYIWQCSCSCHTEWQLQLHDIYICIRSEKVKPIGHKVNLYL